MKNRQKVSIIIPIYNAESYLERCIKSVIGQSYNNIEVILINDGSSDHSGEVCKKYASIDNRIIYISQKNAGPSIARNKGLELCTGEYIQFVDSDDVLSEKMTETLVSSMNKNADLVICGYRMLYLDFDKEKSKTVISPNIGINNKKEFMENFVNLYKYDLINPLWNKLYLADTIRNGSILFNPIIKMGEDLMFNIKYIELCNRINIIDEVLYNYLAIEPGSLTRTYKVDFFKVQKLLYSNVKSLMDKNSISTFKNVSLINEMFFNVVIASFENIVNGKNELIKRTKIDEIKLIARDDLVVAIASNVKYSKYSLQNKLISFFIVSKAHHSIYSIFRIKGFIRENSNKLYNIFRKIN